MMLKICACSFASSRSSLSFSASFRLLFILCWSNSFYHLLPTQLSGCLGLCDIYRNNTLVLITLTDRCSNDICGLGLCICLACIGTDDLPKLSQDNDRLISLLKASADDIKFNVLTNVGLIKIAIADVKVAREQNLKRRNLRVKTNLALEHYRCLKDLPRVREAQISLKANTVVQTTLQNVRSSEGVFNDRNATGLNISLRQADSFVLVPKLSNQTGKDVTLKETGIHMNVPSELTTFIKIHCAFLCV